MDQITIDGSSSLGSGDSDEQLVVISTIELAHNLGLSVVADGPVTPPQARSLSSSG